MTLSHDHFVHQVKSHWPKITHFVRHPRNIDFESWSESFAAVGLGSVFEECRAIMPTICRRRVAFVLTFYACAGEKQISQELGPQVERMNECIGAKLEEVRKMDFVWITY